MNTRGKKKTQDGTLWILAKAKNQILKTLPETDVTHAQAEYINLLVWQSLYASEKRHKRTERRTEAVAHSPSRGHIIITMS